MRLRPTTRASLNRVNGTTAIGLLLARLVGTPVTYGPLGTRIAANYRLRRPDATCFVIGDVIFCRRSATWLLSRHQRPLLTHEIQHTYQYALLGPVFWPLYVASCTWSYTITGSAGARNVFERRAGLSGGGYRDAPARSRWRTASRS